jgi:hypothetical protein
MFSYLRQVAICESVRQMIKRALAQSDDVDIRPKANNISSTDNILRAVRLSIRVDNEERLKDFIIENVLRSLHLTSIQREHLSLSS